MRFALWLTVYVALVLLGAFLFGPLGQVLD